MDHNSHRGNRTVQLQLFFLYLVKFSGIMQLIQFVVEFMGTHGHVTLLLQPENVYDL